MDASSPHNNNNSNNNKNWRDKVWLGWFVLQLLAIGCFDAVPFYPAWLYQPPGAPLHALERLRAWYVAAYDDPVVQPGKAPHYMGILFGLEVALQLPVAAYYVVVNASYCRKTTTTVGPLLELVLLVYALETALSTVLVLDFVYALDPVAYPLKNVLLFQNYLPWFLAPTLMFVDMFCRLYKRLSTADLVKKNQ